MMAIPRMKIIDRYVCREFLKAFFFILASLVTITFIVDFVGRIRMFISNNASFEQITAHFGWHIPFFISLTIPASSLLAVLVVFTLMSKNNEIVALKAGGVSVVALIKPLLAIALVIAVVNCLLLAFISSYGLARANHIAYVEVQKRQDVFAFEQNGIWHKDNNAIYNFAFYDPRQETIRGVIVYNLDKDFNIVSRLQAPSAVWQNGAWEMRDVNIVNIPVGDFPVLSKEPSRLLPLKEKPMDFVSLQSDTSMLSLLEMSRYVDKLQKSGGDAAQYLTEIHNRIAFPLINVILVIIGAAFSISFGREGGVALSVGAGLGIGFSYWVVHAVAVSLGKSGFWAPLIAAWSANIIFGVAAVFLLRRVRT